MSYTETRFLFPQNQEIIRNAEKLSERTAVYVRCSRTSAIRSAFKHEQTEFCAALGVNSQSLIIDDIENGLLLYGAGKVGYGYRRSHI